MLGSLGLLLGRICLSAIFILSGVGKFMAYDQTASYMAAKGITFIPFFLVAAALVELIGGLSLLFGCKIRWGATLLLLYLIPVTVLFHDFWSQTDPATEKLQMIMFMKNLAIMGGLWYAIVCGGGRLSCDACCHKKAAERSDLKH